jgi:hypothetical protein
MIRYSRGGGNDKLRKIPKSHRYEYMMEIKLKNPSKESAANKKN